MRNLLNSVLCLIFAFCVYIVKDFTIALGAIAVGTVIAGLVFFCSKSDCKNASTAFSIAAMFLVAICLVVVWSTPFFLKQNVSSSVRNSLWELTKLRDREEDFFTRLYMAKGTSDLKAKDSKKFADMMKDFSKSRVTYIKTFLKIPSYEEWTKMDQASVEVFKSMGYIDEYRETLSKKIMEIQKNWQAMEFDNKDCSQAVDSVFIEYQDLITSGSIQRAVEKTQCQIDNIVKHGKTLLLIMVIIMLVIIIYMRLHKAS